MYAVLRNSSGKDATEIASFLEQNKTQVEKLLRSIHGFVSYFFVRTDDGSVSVSVFQDKASAEEGIPVQLDWIAKNAPNVGPPVVSKGPVLISIGPVA
jgi:hypothetical protein